MGDTLSILTTAAERKAAADKVQAEAAEKLAVAVKSAIADKGISTATIREVTGLSKARIYQINKG